MATKTKPKPSLAQRVRTDPELLRRALADPGLRSKLPDKYLSPTQRKARDERRFTSALGDYTTPLSGSNMQRVARTLVDKETASAERDIATRERNTVAQRDAQQRWAKDYSDRLNSIFASSLTAQQTANQGASQAARDASRDRAAGIEEARRQAMGRVLEDTNRRGAGLDGGSSQRIEEQARQNTERAAAQGKTHEDAADSYGQVQEALLRGVQAAGAQQGREWQGAIGTRAANQLAEATADRRALTERKSGALTETLLKLRDSEREGYLTERGLANDAEKARLDAKAAIAEAKTKAQLDAAQRRHEIVLKQMGIDADSAKLMAQQEFASAQNALDRQTRLDVAGGKKKPRFTTAAMRASAEDRDKAIAEAEIMRRRGTSDRKLALDSLTRKYGPLHARVAIGAIYDGGAVDHLDAELKEKYGIGIPRKYRRRTGGK